MEMDKKWMRKDGENPEIKLDFEREISKEKI
jgi:hypothetical protein